MSKKRIINIKPQEVTVDGERSVQYKGSDGKMHSMMPQDAALPVVRREVIKAGSEITLAETREIEGFDFNKVESLELRNFEEVRYQSFVVNYNGEGQKQLMYSYHGNPWWTYKKVGDEYQLFSDSSDNTTEENQNTEEAAARMSEIMLEIAKSTGMLMLYKDAVFTPNLYDSDIVLTLAEDYVVNEQFFMQKYDGSLVQIGEVTEETDGGDAAGSNVAFDARNAFLIIYVGERNSIVKKFTDGVLEESSASELVEALENDLAQPVLLKENEYNSIYVLRVNHFSFSAGEEIENLFESMNYWRLETTYDETTYSVQIIDKTLYCYKTVIH